MFNVFFPVICNPYKMCLGVTVCAIDLWLLGNNGIHVSLCNTDFEEFCFFPVGV